MKFLSSVWSSASGSIGGTTYSTGQGGLIAKARKVPTNPNTIAQQSIRSAMGTASNNWGNVLSAAQRQSWEDYASLTPLTNSLGQEIIVSGVQMYQRFASVRGFLGLSSESGVTVTSGLGQAPTAVTGSQATNEFDVKLGPGASDDGNVYCTISAALSPGMNSVKRALTLVGQVAVMADDTEGLVPSNVTLVAGQRYVLRSRIVYEDGRLSQARTEIVTIGA